MGVWEGVYFLKDFTACKLVHALEAGLPDSVEVLPEQVLLHGEISQSLAWQDGCLVWDLTGKGEARASLDVREASDFRTDGRVHDITVEEVDSTWIARVAVRDHRFVIVSNAPLSVKDGWKAVATTYDERRDGRAEWWVHEGIKVSVEQSSRVVLAPADQLATAMSALRSSIHSVGWTDDLAGDVARASLQGMLCCDPSICPGILAGLPWFHQVWGRDEAISVGGLITAGELGQAREVLLRQARAIKETGVLANRFPPSALGSADATGWWALRVEQLLARKGFMPGDLPILREATTHAARSLRSRMSRGFIISGPRETWMDTNGGTDDVRAGARIEVQALAVRVLTLEHVLCDAPIDAAVQLRDRILQEFVHHEEIADGVGDWRQRPNALLASYVAPELLESAAWREATLALATRLLSSWGGLATLDPADPLYQPSHTGADDRSYHRGDSWYWVNNLAAVVLASMDDDRAREMAQRILAASLRDLLCLGAAGHCSEISSHGVQEPFGCHAQAWSASSLLELLAATGSSWEHLLPEAAAWQPR